METYLFSSHRSPLLSWVVELSEADLREFFGHTELASHPFKLALTRLPFLEEFHESVPKATPENFSKNGPWHQHVHSISHRLTLLVEDKELLIEVSFIEQELGDAAGQEETGRLLNLLVGLIVADDHFQAGSHNFQRIDPFRLGHYFNAQTTPNLPHVQWEEGAVSRKVSEDTIDSLKIVPK